jgi:hypothetical protein
MCMRVREGSRVHESERGVSCARVYKRGLVCTGL